MEKRDVMQRWSTKNGASDSSFKEPIKLSILLEHMLEVWALNYRDS